MKKRTLFLIVYIFFVSTFIVNAQKKLDDKSIIEVNYRLEIKINKEDFLPKVPIELREKLKQDIANGIFLDYTLKSDNKNSIFQLNPKIDNNQNSKNLIVSQMEEQDKEPFYKNYYEKKYLKKYNVAGKSFLIKDDLIDYKWKLTKEQTKINGFNAIKAEGVMQDSVKIEAWYSKDIPVKDGPDRFYGLPGLILKASFYMNGGEMIYTVENIKTLPYYAIDIYDSNKQKTFTFKEFLQTLKSFSDKNKEMVSGGVDKD